MMSKKAFKEKAKNGFNKTRRFIKKHKGKIITVSILAGTTIVIILKKISDQADCLEQSNSEVDFDWIDTMEIESETNDDIDVIYSSKSDVFKDVAARVLNEEYDVRDFDVRDSEVYATILSHRRRCPRPSIFKFDDDGDLTYYTVTYPGERTTYGIGSRISRKLKEAYHKYENETADEAEE